MQGKLRDIVKRPLVLLLVTLLLLPGLPGGAKANGNPLTVYFFASKPVYRQGEPIELHARLVNISEQPVEVWFPTGQAYSFQVRPQGGAQVWRSGDGQRATTQVQRYVLQPGEHIPAHAVWHQTDADGAPVGPGTYLIGVAFAGAEAGPVNGWSEQPVVIRG